MAELDVKKMVLNKPKIKRLELEYGDMNYIIVNLEEKVIDDNGKLKEYTDDKNESICNLVWQIDSIDEFLYWPDKTKDHSPMSILWRLSFYDEYDVYYHKSGVTKYPDDFMKLVDMLQSLK